MKTLRRAWRRGSRRVLGVFEGWRHESELADELASHIEMQTEDNLRAGMAPAEARRAARLQFGNLELVKESYRGQRGLPWVEALFADLRFAFRGMRRSPGFTAVAVLTLALGIGAITAVFSLVDQVLLAPPGIRNPERVIAIQTRYRKLNLELPIASPRVLADLHESPQVFEYAALSAPRDLNYTGAQLPERLKAAAVTASWFDVFGASPQLGRAFRNEEDQPHANRVVVLSYAAWTRLFGADPSVLGRAIDLDQLPHRIVGVMPPDFRWPRDVDVWTPAGLSAAAFDQRARFGKESFTAVARTRAGVSSAAAKDWMRIFTSRIHNGGGPAGAVAKDYGWSLAAVSFTETVAGETKKPLLVLLGAVAFVLLIVCSNIAGLLLARASARGREFAVRSALGASRGQLLRALLSESLLLGIAGGVAGLALAVGGVKWLLILAPPDVAAGLQPRMDTRILLFCAVAAIASAVLFGFAPAWQISRIGPNSALKGDDRASAGQGRQRMRSMLVVAETALALILLVAGGLFLRSLVRLRGVNPGFDPRGVMTAVFWLPQQIYPTGKEQTVFYRALLDRLNHTAGVESAALANPVPFSGYINSDVFQIEGRIVRHGEPLPFGDVDVVTPEYFRALSIPLRRGRYFTDTDRAGAEPVAVIDENLARQYWPGEDAVGKRIIHGGETYRIAGIVGHVTHSDLSADSGKGVYYFSMLQRATPSAWILVKTERDTAYLPAAIRQAVREANPRQPVYSVRGMEDLVGNSLAPRRFAMRLLGFFAVTALFLAALGLYGVTSYGVAQRKREIGIRIALGAEPESVIRLVVGRGLRLAAVGAAIGTAGCVAGARLIQNQLFGVGAHDPLTIAAMGAILLAAATLASYLPARRAMRVDPVVALRPE